MWKYLEYVEDYRALLATRRDSRYMDYPFKVSFETLTLCNAICDFCPYPSLTRKGTMMSDSLIAKIIDECRSIPSDLPLQIVPLRVNEPFLDKRIFDICQHIGDTLPNATIPLFSNGSPLNPPNLSKLAGLENIALLVISLHDHRPDVYERVMGLPLARTLRNLEGLHELKAAGAIKFPVTISRVGDGSSFDEEFCRWGRERFPLFTVYSTARANWMGAVDTLVSPVPQVGCGQWFDINILADGKVAFCCIDSDARFGSGNAAEEHLLEIYNRPARRRLRQELRNRGEIPECANCSLLS
ncbi:MAG TPA: SPASM domain-containing protein [Bryobacteraceae bacterium]|nr:SPASM domain-containing protein [Bryobacteraceae bacterium]